MPFQLIKTIGQHSPVKFVTRDWQAKGTAAHLKPHCIEFRITLSCEYLDGENHVVPPDSLLELTQVVCNAVDGKVIIAEDDPWKDELCSMEGLGVLSALVVPSTSLERICTIVMTETDRWLFELEQNGRVWIDRIEARSEGFHAALQRH